VLALARLIEGRPAGQLLVDLGAQEAQLVAVRGARDPQRIDDHVADVQRSHQDVASDRGEDVAFAPEGRFGFGHLAFNRLDAADELVAGKRPDREHHGKAGDEGAANRALHSVHRAIVSRQTAADPRTASLQPAGPIAVVR
jgi:hypothetical protein